MTTKSHLQLKENQLIDLFSIADIGIWEWNLHTDKVVFNDKWADILGYNTYELVKNIKTWERLVYKEDLPYIKAKIKTHLEDVNLPYKAEFRMVHKDGSLIWVQDSGMVMEYDANQEPWLFVGALIDISTLKNAEMTFETKQSSFEYSVNNTSLGIWNWDIANDVITYNNEYLNMLGYNKNEVDCSIEGWKKTCHPQDVSGVLEALSSYINGESSNFECELRMRHKDGSYIWIKDIGKAIEKDIYGKTVRIIGEHLNINDLKRTQEKLTEALDNLTSSKLNLENQVKSATLSLMEQDSMMLKVNDIARILLAFDEDKSFDVQISQCLMILGEATKHSRVFIWKDLIDDKGNNCCTQVYEWTKDVFPIKDIKKYENVSYDLLPTFKKTITEEKCLNSFVSTLSESEQQILSSQLILTILIAPIKIKNENWGFIGIDNCENETLFSDAEKNLLLMSGFLIGNAIQSDLTQKELTKADELTNIMLNSTPICCNLWNTNFKLIACNDEAIRLFNITSKQEFIDGFYNLSPKYQPCGELSFILAQKKLAEAFKKGHCKFEWLHQNLTGGLIPTEVILVRTRYQDDFIITGYTRDLRDEKAMILEMQEIQSRLLTSQKEAIISSNAKTNFLANMSHEIRTPMNVISGLAEMISRESNNTSALSHALEIKKSCSNLLNIIDDILDISSIESGNLELKNSKYSLSSVLNDVISITEMHLGEKPVLFAVNIDSNLPNNLYGDEKRLKQILINLLGNAVKFTKSGHIIFNILGEYKNGEALIHFEISDTGIGIKESSLKDLFEEFASVDTTKDRNKGAGLGLAITKRLCALMKGNVKVSSIYGKGSVFTVSIPHHYKQYTPIASVAHKKTILLYEPKELFFKFIKQSIINLGCTFIGSMDYSQLYNNISKEKYDYVLTSYIHIKKIKTLLKKNNSDAKILMISKLGRNESEAGVYSLYTPVTSMAIADVLNNSPTSVPTADMLIKTISFIAPTAKILIADDSIVNLKVVVGLMEPYKIKIDTASNGLEAVTMIKNNVYDLVFMDYLMPQMDGVDATATIRNTVGEYYQNLPIVALTANAIVGAREMFIKEGMNDFLAKPIDLAELNSILSKWLPSDKKEKYDYIEKKSTPLHNIEIDGVDTDQGIESIGGNVENYLQILAVFYFDGIKRLSNLLKLFSSQSLQGFKIEVHALKSASATIGANSIADEANEIEEITANKEPIEYAEERIFEFLSDFRMLLDNIKPFAEQHKSVYDYDYNNANPVGDNSFLTKKIKVLQHALDYADIKQIEAVLKAIFKYQWSSAITKELMDIADYVSFFNYDDAIKCVATINKCLK